MRHITLGACSLSVDALAVGAFSSVARRQYEHLHLVPTQPQLPGGTLFDGKSTMAKGLHPKLYLAYDLRKSAAPICGMMTVCDFTRDDSLSTNKLTNAFCSDRTHCQRMHQQEGLSSVLTCLFVATNQLAAWCVFCDRLMRPDAP